jgi:hypothetical protein
MKVKAINYIERIKEEKDESKKSDLIRRMRSYIASLVLGRDFGQSFDEYLKTKSEYIQNVVKFNRELLSQGI